MLEGLGEVDFAFEGLKLGAGEEGRIGVAGKILQTAQAVASGGDGLGPIGAGPNPRCARGTQARQCARARHAGDFAGVGKARAAAGDLATAEKLLRRVIEQEQASSLAESAHYQLAQIYRTLKRPADADREMKLFQGMRKTRR